MKAMLKASISLAAMSLLGASALAGDIQNYNPNEGLSANLMVPTRPDLINAGTNNTEFNSRFIVGNPGSVGTFGNTASLGGLTGVGGLRIVTPAGAFSCTATLVAPDVVITAAHCVEGATTITFSTPNYRVQSTTVNPINPGPIQTYYATSMTIHPDWTGSVADGNDIALVKLAAPMTNVDTYEIYRGNGAIYAQHIKVGSGTSGWGLVGNDTTPGGVVGARGSGFFDGRKRAGFNMYEAMGQDFFDAIWNDPLTASGLQLGGPQYGILIYDYDSGSSLNDVFGNLDAYSPQFTGAYWHKDTGIVINGQNWEVNASPGDSGGSTFIQDTDGVWRIVGITSFGITGGLLDGVCGGYNQTTGVWGGGKSPVSGRAPLDTSGTSSGTCNDSSWGELGGDTNVAAFASWYDMMMANQQAFTVLAPEPGSLALLGAGLAALGIARRRTRK